MPERFPLGSRLFLGCAFTETESSEMADTVHNIPRFPRQAKNRLRVWREAILVGGMIRGGFLDASIREDLIALVRDGKAETRLTRRANALLLLDDGMSCEAIAKVLYLDDDTIRYWYKLYGEKGLSWLADFGYKGCVCELTMV